MKFFAGRWTVEAWGRSPANPIGGTTPVRMVIKIVGPDGFTSENFMALPDGKGFLSMTDRSVRMK